MKTMRRLFTLMLLAGLILGAVQSDAWARASDTPMGGSAIVTDGQAKGTKLTGPVTIYYDVDPVNPTLADIYFFMRLRMGHTLRIFGGKKEAISYNNIHLVQLALEQFVGDTVIPALFGLAVPYWALKSVDQIIEPDDPTATPGCCGGLFFTILDVVIAVED